MFVIQQSSGDMLFLSSFDTETGAPIWDQTARVYPKKEIALLALNNASSNRVVSLFTLKPEFISD